MTRDVQRHFRGFLLAVRGAAERTHDRDCVDANSENAISDIETDLESALKHLRKMREAQDAERIFTNPTTGQSFIFNKDGSATLIKKETAV